MATMNFSLPDELKARFDACFGQRNKSAILAACIEAALEKEALKERRIVAYEAMERVRATLPSVPFAELMRIRDEIRAESDEGNYPSRRIAPTLSADGAANK
jgi:predicted DNA-binding protein